MYDNSFYINQKIYANKLLDMDFPRLDDPKTHDDLSQILQNEKWSGYGLGRVLDVETKLPMSVFGVLGVVALNDGQRNVMVGISNDKIVYVPFNKAIKIDKPIDKELINVLAVLSI